MNSYPIIRIMYHILYIDDEPSLLDIGKRFLEESGDFTVTKALSASEALRLLEQEKFDCIVSDFQMPEMDGIQLLVEVRKRFGRLPFILFTGRGREEVVIQALNEGADFYLQKGGEPKAQFAELSHKINRSVGGWHAEDALRESEDKYRSLADNLPEYIFIHHEGKLLYVSPTVVNVTGMTAAELTRRSVMDFIAPESRALVSERIRQSILKEQSYRYEAAILVKNGEKRYGLVNSILITYNGLPASLVVVTDITERKRDEEALRESEARLSSIIRVAPVGIGVVSDRVIQTVNDRLCQMSGYTTEELIGKSSRILYPTQEDFDYVGREKYAQIAQKGSGSVETRWQKKDGTIIDILLSSTPINPSDLSAGVTFTALEVTERKRTEKELRESENKFATIFKSNPVLLTLVSATDGIFVDVNDAFLSNTGYTREEVIGKTTDELGIFADMNEHQQMVSLLRTGHRVDRQAIHTRTKNGETRFCEFSCSFILMGRRPYIISSIVDITDRKKAESALRESEEKFRLLTENSPDLIFIQDRDLRYTWVLNPQLGLMTEDMVGKTDYDFLTREEADKLTLVKRQVLVTGKAAPYETSLISRQGGPEYFDGAYLPKYDKEGKVDGLMGYFRNITHRKQEEKRISEVNNAFLKFRPDPVENINILTGLAGKLLQGTCALYNRLEGEMLCSLGMWNTPPDFAPCDHPEGHICYDVIRDSSNSPTIIINLLESPYAETDPNVRRYQLQTYIGIPVGIGGKFLGSLCVVYQHIFSPSPQDLEILSFLAKAIAVEDERRTAVLALCESEAKHRILIEESSDPLFTFTAGGQYTYANKALAKAFGTPVEEIIGKRIWDFFPKEEADKRFAALSQVFRTGEKSEVEGPVRRPDGEGYYLTTITPVKDPSGTVISAICTSIDITGRKQAADALRQANKKLNLLSGITRHDIKNQLLSLNGFLEISKKYFGDAGKMSEFITKEGKITKAMERQIAFTKEYESIGVKAPVWQDCRALLETAAKQAPLGKVLVKNDLPAGVEIFADPLIVKVCYNLMDNAVRYGEKITTIRFSVEERDGDHIVVCEDDGVGIPAKEKEQIFEMGFGKNSGMGLFLSAEILSITGITISETGEPGKGARFEMVVPKGAYRLADLK